MQGSSVTRPEQPDVRAPAGQQAWDLGHDAAEQVRGNAMHLGSLQAPRANNCRLFHAHTGLPEP